MVTVLRLGHRAGRDDRISTHVGLTARQWGAEKVIYSGEKDSSMIQSVEDIIGRWGGSMEVEFTENPLKMIKEFDGPVVHLTMYGLEIDEKEAELDELGEDVLIVVGAEKVPREVYKEADFNIGVGNQPHSEIAALAVYMDRFYDINGEFEEADIEVLPSRQHKKTSEGEEN